MKIKLFKTGPIRTNSYIIWDELSKEAAIIDPAGQVGKINTTVRKNKLNVKFIINTHGHYDHILANKQLQDKLGAKILIHRDEKNFLTNEVKSHARESGFKVGKTSPARLLKEGDTISIGKYNFEVIETPGHSKADISLYEPREKILFSGDTLFGGCIGRTDLPESDPRKMQRSLKKLARLPGNTKVYPGHGWSTTIDNEKKAGTLPSS
jgi:hydroxyacylglutathione hydrolase